MARAEDSLRAAKKTIRRSADEIRKLNTELIALRARCKLLEDLNAALQFQAEQLQVDITALQDQIASKTAPETRKRATTRKKETVSDD